MDYDNISLIERQKKQQEAFIRKITEVLIDADFYLAVDTEILYKIQELTQQELKTRHLSKK